MDRNECESEPLIFQGCVVKSDEEHITLQLSPGFNIDVERKQCVSMEEATDPVSGATFVRVRLVPDAEVHATFQPRLARLAASASGAIPFTPGGWPEGVQQGPVYVDPVTPGEGPLLRPRANPTIGTFRTHSYNLIWGWCSDDATYHDYSASPAAMVHSWPGH